MLVSKPNLVSRSKYDYVPSFYTDNLVCMVYIMLFAYESSSIINTFITPLQNF